MFGLSEPHVAGIVSFSRLDMESRLRQWPGYFDRSREWFSESFGLDSIISADAFREFAESDIFAFELVQEVLSSPGHARVLFAIGGQERLSDRQWLTTYAARATGAVEYHEFAGLTHSLNVRQVGKNMWLYDHRAIDRVASALARWIHGRPITGSTG